MIRALALLVILSVEGIALPAQAQECQPAKRAVVRMPPRPPESLRGTAQVLATVARDGTVTDAKIVISGHVPEIDAFALEYARTAWRYVLPGNKCLAASITTPLKVVF